ncbi:hypothetical protein MUO14_08385 [Halobacillus shinanisalinarum]|uniref:Uncharacterized protein n=1 Tax=Halobacillus shinanisalinarum TaxID=2932258 RepID=A0ABY4H3J8_9BACI|nr:hypothetical protein [Halobacillus shinanisalinarum]UOQ94929.1 hypothetical protein MUO14_08385 [Halobacillus shinanisalinarum]
MAQAKRWMVLALSLVFMLSMVILPQRSFASGEKTFKNEAPSPSMSYSLFHNGYLFAAPQAEIRVGHASVLVHNLKSSNIHAVNYLLAEEGVQRLPEDTTSIEFKTDGTSMITTSSGKTEVLPTGFWGNAWKVTKCAAFITAAVVPIFKAYKAVRALGGVRETARLLVGAGNSTDFLQIAGGTAAEIIGISGIQKNCF